MGAKQNLVLEDSVAKKLILRHDMIRLFPELAAMARSLGGRQGCFTCGGNRRAVNEALNAVKAAVTQLSQDRQNQLKQALNTASLTVVYRGAEGVREVTI